TGSTTLCFSGLAVWAVTNRTGVPAVTSILCSFSNVPRRNFSPDKSATTVHDRSTPDAAALLPWARSSCNWGVPNENVRRTPVATLQTRIVPSSLLLASNESLPQKVTACTQCLWPVMIRDLRFVSAFHTSTLQSSAPLTTCSPLGLYAMLSTRPEWPANRN